MVNYFRYTISTSLLTSVYYTGNYTGKVAVLARLLPTRLTLAVVTYIYHIYVS